MPLMSLRNRWAVLQSAPHSGCIVFLWWSCSSLTWISWTWKWTLEARLHSSSAFLSAVCPPLCPLLGLLNKSNRYSGTLSWAEHSGLQRNWWAACQRDHEIEWGSGSGLNQGKGDLGIKNGYLERRGKLAGWNSWCRSVHAAAFLHQVSSHASFSLYPLVSSNLVPVWALRSGWACKELCGLPHLLREAGGRRGISNPPGLVTHSGPPALTSW